MSTKATIVRTKRHPLGVPLNAYNRPLYEVSAELNAKPEAAIPVYDRLRPHEQYLRKRFCYQDAGLPFEQAFDYERWKGGLPVQCFSQFTFDEFAKVWYSRDRMPLHYQDLFQPSSLPCNREPEIHHWLIGKLDNSMFRWGCSRSDWNSLVAFYRAITRFEFGLPGFTVHLDHTTWFNDRGFSYHTRTYLDGVFGYLIRYRGEHVMTIGFSASRERRLLINQVQLKRARGNRWLYKLPAHYLDYVVERIGEAFPARDGFTLYLTDGKELANRIKASYHNPTEGPNPDALNRVAVFYSRPLQQYVRRGHSRVNQQRFHRLVSRRQLRSESVRIAA